MTEVLVVGSLDVPFPQMCVHCGSAPETALPIHKVFCRRQVDNTPMVYLVRSVRIPVCSQCLRAHEQERSPIDRRVKNSLLRLWFLEAMPFLFPLGVSLFFVKVLVPMVIKTATHSHKMWEVLLIGGICAFFGLLAASFISMIRNRGNQLIWHSKDMQREHYAEVERGPLGCCFVVETPPTSVSGSVDYSDDCSELFDSERHLYRFENADVAAQFAQLNANRQWDPTTPKAQRARVARWIVIGAILLFGLYQVLCDLLR